MNTSITSQPALANEWSEAARRLFVALMIFMIVIALSLLLPRTMNGELSSAEMTPHAPLRCIACPPTDQITAAGMSSTENGSYLNVQFAALPLNTDLRISFADQPGEIQLTQSDKSWRYSYATLPGSPSLTAIDQRGDKLVLTFPATLRTAGFAVTTGTGDRLPAAGFAPLTYPVAAHFNLTDLVLLLILAATAWYGTVRGFVLEIVDLSVLALSLVIAAIAYRPLAALFSSIADSSAAAATIGSGLTVVGVVFAGVFLVRRCFPAIGTMPGPFGAPANAVLGGAAGCMRQLPVLAMLLAAATDLAVLQWASGSIHSSLFGGALIHAWKTLFSGIH